MDTCKKMKNSMNIVIVGHVDHGKSTIIGRLLADTNSLPEGKLDQIKKTCERNSKPFEYAFLLDALKDEQAQGITIDTARVFFETNLRKYIIMDAPGHIEFLKNMITGASSAEAALLVIDANEGVKENSRRHGYLLSLLGITQIAVLINKMDIIDYHENIFNKIVHEYSEFLETINIKPKLFIPVSGFEGDNVASSSDKMPWYKNKNILEILDLFKPSPSLEKKDLRITIQDVYKFTRFGDSRRIFVGNIETGTLNVNDEICFYPSGKKSKIATIESFNTKRISSVIAGNTVGFTIKEQIYIKRGEIVSKEKQSPPAVSSLINASIFWLSKNPLKIGKEYYLKLGTAKVSVKIEKIIRIIDSSSLKDLESTTEIKRHEVAECILKLNHPIAFDLTDKFPITSRFVIIDKFEISGGGIIKESLSDQQMKLRKKVYRRNDKWIESDISHLERAKKYNQKATMLIITGEKHTGRKNIAKQLEKSLFNSGKFVYYLGLGNVKHGVDADLDKNKYVKNEHLRRFAEVSHIMLDSGVVLIVTAQTLSQNDLENIKTSVSPDLITTIWIGDEITTDLVYDFQIESHSTTSQAVSIIEEYLEENGIVFKVW